MAEEAGFMVRAVLIGVGATIVLDLWSVLAARLFGFPAPDWGLVGRWIGHFPKGRFRHERIAAATPVPGERTIGWAAHYAIGIGFAALLLVICGPGWARHPTPLPALIFGIVTLAAPFLIMQPGMGAGIAASRTPNPPVSRLRSILGHSVFGLGLYLSALMLSVLLPM